jgi:F0F1-type ATP synthase assembly protein I
MTAQPRKNREPGKNGASPEPSEGTGWAVMSYLIGGMALYGLIGWLIGRWTHFSGAFPIGMALGLGLALALIIFRFARP